MIAIQVEKLSKSYKVNKQLFLALKDVSFVVNTGERLAIIGQNGSGKSTLLKIISGITGPDSGSIKRLANSLSILGSGVGFNNELTGRDNIYLYASLLGVPKAKVKSDINEIINFSGLGQYIDIPLKYYSSGMRVRIAFATATSNLFTPELLILDELLAVGDIWFQKQCYQRIFSKKNTQTIVFVTHNLHEAIKYSTKCLWLVHGQVKMFDSVKNVVDCYSNLALTNLN